MKTERKVLTAYDILKTASTDLIVKLSVLIPEEIIKAAGFKDLELEIMELYENDKRINAIKLYRKEIDSGLREAKEACDRIANYNR